MMDEWIDQQVHTLYWRDDLSCLIVMLTLLSERFGIEIAPQVMEAARGLNAGRVQSQCGLVEGALLFIGIYAKTRGMNDAQAQQKCLRFSQAFQDKFGSVLCAVLRPQGFASDNPPHLCEKVTKRAVAFAIVYVENNMNGADCAMK